jgi:hypothetical protein
MEQNIQIDEFEKTIDIFIFEHFNKIHGDSQDIIFCPDFRILIILRTVTEFASYYTPFIDMSKIYTINQIIKDSEILQTFIKIHDSYTISVLCQFDDKNEKNEKNEKNNDKSILLLKKEVKKC